MVFQSKLGQCNHVMSLYDNHSFCTKCRNKNKGFDVCVLKSQPVCQSCISYKEYQKHKKRFNKSATLQTSLEIINSSSPSKSPNMSFEMDFGKASRVSSPNPQNSKPQNSKSNEIPKESKGKIKESKQFDAELNQASETKHQSKKFGTKLREGFVNLVEKVRNKKSEKSGSKKGQDKSSKENGTKYKFDPMTGQPLTGSKKVSEKIKKNDEEKHKKENKKEAKKKNTSSQSVPSVKTDTKKIEKLSQSTGVYIKNKDGTYSLLKESEKLQPVQNENVPKKNEKKNMPNSQNGQNEPEQNVQNVPSKELFQNKQMAQNMTNTKGEYSHLSAQNASVPSNSNNPDYYNSVGAKPKRSVQGSVLMPSTSTSRHVQNIPQTSHLAKGQFRGQNYTYPQQTYNENDLLQGPSEEVDPEQETYLLGEQNMDIEIQSENENNEESSTCMMDENRRMLLVLAQRLGEQDIVKQLGKPQKRNFPIEDKPELDKDFYRPDAKKYKYDSHNQSDEDSDSENLTDPKEDLDFRKKIKLIYSILGKDLPSPKEKDKIINSYDMGFDKSSEFKLPPCEQFQNGFNQMVNQILGTETLVPIKETALPRLPLIKRQKFYKPSKVLWHDKEQTLNPNWHLISKSNAQKDPDIVLTQTQAKHFESRARQNINALSATDCINNALKMTIQSQNELLAKMADYYFAQGICDEGLQTLINQNWQMGELMESLSKALVDMAFHNIGMTAMWPVLRRDSYLKQLDKFVSSETTRKLRGSPIQSHLLFNPEAISQGDQEIQRENTLRQQRGYGSGYTIPKKVGQKQNYPKNKTQSQGRPPFRGRGYNQRQGRGSYRGTSRGSHAQYWENPNYTRPRRRGSRGRGSRFQYKK